MSKKVQTFLTADRAHQAMNYKRDVKIIGAARAKTNYDELVPQIKEDLRHPGLKYIGLTPPGTGAVYPIGLFQIKDGYKIIAGCRTFSPKAAKRHWGNVVKVYETSTLGEDDPFLDHKDVPIGADRYRRAKAMLKKLPKLHAKAIELGYVKK